MSVRLPYEAFAAGDSQPVGAARLWPAALAVLQCYSEWAMVDDSRGKLDAREWPDQATSWDGTLGKEFSADGFRVWNFTDKANALLFYIVRVADERSGLCSLHRFGEDPTCTVCFRPHSEDMITA